MNGIRTGRSAAKPKPRIRRPRLLREYAELHRGLPCEWCWDEDESLTAWTELHHILGGSAGRSDEHWNVVAICRWHHQDPVFGFHGSAPQWNHAAAFEVKCLQGYELPPAAWGYLPEGRDACPTPEPSIERNRRVTVDVCNALRTQGGIE